MSVLFRRRIRAFASFGAAIILSAFALGQDHAHDRRLNMPPQSADGQQFSKNAVLIWNEAMLQAIKDSHYEPPVTARALAIVFSSMYDAWTMFDPVATPVYRDDKAVKLFSANPQRIERVVSYAAYYSAVDLYPEESSFFNSVLLTQGFRVPRSEADMDQEMVAAKIAADAVLSARHNDGSNQLGNLHSGAYSSYIPYVSKGTLASHWRPLLVSEEGNSFSLEQRFILPHWNLVEPFALPLASSLRSRVGPVDPKRDCAELRAQAAHLLRLSAQLDDRTKSIAEYWADGTGSVQPPGHWCHLAQFVSLRDHHSLDQDIVLFFALANALMDAGIAAWDDKIAFGSPRPISVIRELYKHERVIAWRGPGRGVGQLNGGVWAPYQNKHIVSPGFPEFVSGHSAFSAAAAEILCRYTGKDAFGYHVNIAAGSSLIEPGATPTRNIELRFATFSQAAKQAGISRLYGGIHFERANIEGQRLGREAADLVWGRVQCLLQGKDCIPKTSTYQEKEE